MNSLYDLLGISKTSDSRTIKTAFKKKALLYHPDKNNGDLEKEKIFKKINTAYQILSNPKSRANYDLSIATKTISYPSTCLLYTSDAADE